jgi:hypothetical protein
MKCESDYCIYNQNHTCVLNKITINSLGMCDDCIMIYIDRDFLESEKKQQRKEIFDMYED